MKARARAKLQRGVRRAVQRVESLLEIRAGDPLAADFGGFGAGSVIAYPQRLIQHPEAITVGERTTILCGAVLEAIHPTPELLTIGSDCYFSYDIRLVALNGIHIADRVALGHRVTLADTVHDFKRRDDDEENWQAALRVGRPLIVEEGTWVGSNCVVTGGIVLGKGCIIAPNSVVTRDVPAHTLVGGSPLRELRRRTPDGEWVDVDPEQ
ncbi:MAG TPA: acyltransferase [Mycobacteriales bacterium]|nr:acyltransferase [Mycobacteriales bacterium]